MSLILYIYPSTLMDHSGGDFNRRQPRLLYSLPIQAKRQPLPFGYDCLLAIYTTGLAGDPPRVDRIAGMAPGPRSMSTSRRPPAPSQIKRRARRLASSKPGRRPSPLSATLVPAALGGRQGAGGPCHRQPLTAHCAVQEGVLPFCNVINGLVSDDKRRR